MNNYEWLKKKDLETIGHEMCELVSDEFDDCSRCPVTRFCDVGKNGFIEWLKQEKDRPCDKCVYHKKNEDGYYMCSRWKCVWDEVQHESNTNSV